MATMTLPIILLPTLTLDSKGKPRPDLAGASFVRLLAILLLGSSPSSHRLVGTQGLGAVAPYQDVAPLGAPAIRWHAAAVG
jgi:hypothetical protein